MITQDEIKKIYADIDQYRIERIMPHEWTRKEMVSNDEHGRTERQLVFIADKLVDAGIWHQRSAIGPGGRRVIVYSRVEDV